MGAVELGARPIDDYRTVVGDEAIDALREAAEPLAGARVLHVSSTAFGGGVAEELASLLALLRDLGLDVHWRIIDADDDFITVTKAIHNGLQGMEVEWTPDMTDRYLQGLEAQAGDLAENWDTVVVHDPQPCALRSFVDVPGAEPGRWVWRCHLDATNARPEVWELLRPHVEAYDVSVWTMDDYVPRDLDHARTAIFPPCIDPLSDKNRDLPREEVEQVCRAHGIDPRRPLVVQVSRFDPWKDPVGVIEAHQLIRQRVPDVQLALIGSMAADDPEGPRYRALADEARDGDPSVHMLENLDDAEVNALQRAATVVMQKSLREGFGLTVSEALWKCRPVVGGRVGGIVLQIRDGVDGYLVDSVEEAAERTIELLLDGPRSADMGVSGHDWVGQNFLITHLVKSHLDLLVG